jgi:hypothetical protein
VQTIGTKKSNNAKRDRKAFASLITTPAVGVFVFPANATVYARSVSGCAAGTTACTFRGRTIRTPLLAAGQAMLVGVVEKSTSLTPFVGFDILIDMGLGKVAKVGGA